MELKDVVFGKKYRWDGTDGDGFRCVGKPCDVVVHEGNGGYFPLRTVATKETDDFSWFIFSKALSEIPE